MCPAGPQRTRNHGATLSGAIAAGCGTPTGPAMTARVVYRSAVAEAAAVPMSGTNKVRFGVDLTHRRRTL